MQKKKKATSDAIPRNAEQGRKKILMKVRLSPELYREFTDTVYNGNRNAIINRIVRAYLDGKVDLE
jgi:hypothetical protein